MTRVLGIDPGSRLTGFGVVDADGSRYHYVDSGVIRTLEAPFPERLRIIFEDLAQLIATHQPAIMAVEQVFVQKNVSSALKLGHARGAAICAGATSGLDVAEYTPRAVKQALVGTGSADKAQVAHMVRQLLGIDAPLAEDASDALAVALCHVHQTPLQQRIHNTQESRP
ncbi:crossover junction endodeoxyribonuclease RuvC [Aquisalimonas asiatica]|uniref:Crossover junction endodeoxyribonuclease RuvC n=1 Tax=Aquisalimonas asiatica TaxID=406100 RepID=A0A1H8U0R7_9GAMM|nr:crossover junction endodeoxyribonuclease RuvC [Aquisalimonas asiatica]SEO96839.1 Holliday junction endonuclease RuvC [Aquisalimonas asiatica]